jgi:hypothetical protein
LIGQCSEMQMEIQVQRQTRDIPREGPSSIEVNALTDLSSLTVPIIS